MPRLHLRFSSPKRQHAQHSITPRTFRYGREAETAPLSSPSNFQRNIPKRYRRARQQPSKNIPSIVEDRNDMGHEREDGDEEECMKYISSKDPNSILYVPERRTRGRKDDTVSTPPLPVIRADALLHQIRQINTGVHLILLGKGRRLKKPGFEKMQLEDPIAGLRGDIARIALSVAAWARPIKATANEERYLNKGVFKHTKFTYSQMMIQVLKALNRIGDMPDGYVSTFHEFVDQLQPVHDQVILLRNLLKSIKDEGNELDVSEKSADPVKHVQSEESRSSRKLVSELGTEHTEIVSPNLPTDSEHKPEPVSEPASTPKPETEAEAEDAPVSKVASLGIAPFPPPILLPPPVGLQTEIYKPLNDTPIAPVPFSDPIVYDHFRRPPTPRPANCPIWKYNLQEKGLVDIHVGQAEIDAFARAYQGINGIEISLRALITQCELLYDESGDAAAQLIEWENLLADHEHEYRHRQAISSSSAGEDWPSDAPNMSETD